MIKKVKKIEKWLLLILISFCIVFTMINIDGIGLGSVIEFKLDENNILNMSEGEIRQIARECEANIEIQTEAIKNDNETNYGKVFKEYPVGTYTMMIEFSRIQTYSDNLILSFVLGILIGTGIFLVIDEDKKDIKLLILFYILGIFLLGFLEGTSVISDSVLDKWVFPTTYFIPATLMYGVVLVFIKIKQQKLVMELNKKLHEEKVNNQTENLETKNQEVTFLKRTKETREKMAQVGLPVIEIIMILIVLVYIICT